MDPRTEHRVGEIVPQIPLHSRRLINDKKIRDDLESYTGLQRKKTGEWSFTEFNMSLNDYVHLLQRLKDNGHNALRAFMHRTNEIGKETNKIYFNIPL